MTQTAKEDIITKAIHIDQDMREIAKEVNKMKNKADVENIALWLETLAKDVMKFKENVEAFYNI